jgi:hypothetical protein
MKNQTAFERKRVKPSETRRRKMSYAGDRVIQLSMSNIKAAIELFLRNVKEIPEEQIADIQFEHTGLTVKDWQKLEVVPVRLKLRETESVESHRVGNGKNG